MGWRLDDVHPYRAFSIDTFFPPPHFRMEGHTKDCRTGRGQVVGPAAPSSPLRRGLPEFLGLSFEAHIFPFL